MEQTTDTYRIPAGFNPWHTLDAIRGLTGAIHHFMIDGPGCPEHEMSYTDRADLEGLLHALRENVHALHAYFTAIGDFTTLKLPLTDSEFESLHVKHNRKDEVREEPPIYLVR